jgi:fatty-acyl-CoA synthase
MLQLESVPAAQSKQPVRGLRAIGVWCAQRSSEIARLPVLLRLVLPALRLAKSARTAPWLAWLEAHSKRNPDGLFLELDAERVSFSDAWARVRIYAAVLVDSGVERGDVVALIGGNSPSYVLLILAIAHAGATAALLDPELSGAPLEHALSAVQPRLSLAELPPYSKLCELSRPELTGSLLSFGSGQLEARAEFAQPLIESRADPSADFVLIFTSGTTGLPKSCRVPHARAGSAATVFGSVAFEFRAGDKLYCALPLHHSGALLVGVGAALVAGVPIALRRKFSAREFAPDLLRYGATATLYIGDVCRALLGTARLPIERELRLRVAVGNGLDAAIWSAFKRRFGVRYVREFYASTEAPSAILNLTGKLGSLGHVPFERRRGFRLARLDSSQTRIARDSKGRAALCAAGEPGELLLRVFPSRKALLGAFAGYTDEAASQARMLHDVFQPGDAYFRSGDVLRRDQNGYFYFVDRLGDGYRWKGENVSAQQVESVLSAALGFRELVVFGVRVPGYPGRAGFAELVCVEDFDAQRFAQAARLLPSHARPCFVHAVSAIERTSSFKLKRRNLDLATLIGAGSGKVWVRMRDAYLVLTDKLWEDLTSGEARL